jgi:hypothetical protein
VDGDDIDSGDDGGGGGGYNDCGGDIGDGEGGMANDWMVMMLMLAGSGDNDNDSILGRTL